MSDHDELVALVPEKAGLNAVGSNAVGSNAVIDACQRCLGYVKTFNRLKGCSPGAVMLEDLASVDLDVAAIQHGFARPPGPGFALGITVNNSSPRRGFFAWKSFRSLLSFSTNQRDEPLGKYSGDCRKVEARRFHRQRAGGNEDPGWADDQRPSGTE